MYTKPTNVVYFKSESLAGGKKSSSQREEKSILPQKQNNINT